jgi:protein involved in polysaccharide export with SLBB domain
MNHVLLKKILLSAVVVAGLASGQIFAQQTTPTPAKRNSPFAPNPKKKVEPTPAVSPETQPKVEESNQPTVVESEPKKIEEVVSPNEETTAKTTENKEEFESRSVAAKTLEVAKRATAVELSPTEIYKVGIGDVLFVSLQNAPAKETTYFTVLNDGNIDYPLAGEMVQVLGLTTEQIEELLESKIKLYESPQISIKVREHNSHTFTVLGLVEKSGEKTMQREAVPLYLVQTQAIVNPRANQAIIKRGNLENQVINLKDAKSGETLIFPNDIVEFGINDAKVSQFYFIGGEINSGGRRDYTPGLTLTQAILESGGLKKTNAKKVVIRRKNEAGMLVPTEYDLKLIKDGKAVDPLLEAGDTIEIGN